MWVKVAFRVDSRVVRRRVEWPGFWIAEEVEMGVWVGEGGGEFIFLYDNNYYYNSVVCRVYKECCEVRPASGYDMIYSTV